jgi:precorrin isomerase
MSTPFEQMPGFVTTYAVSALLFKSNAAVAHALQALPAYMPTVSRTNMISRGITSVIRPRGGRVITGD